VIHNSSQDVGVHSHGDENSEKAEDVQGQNYSLNKRELPCQYGVEQDCEGGHGND
jgi:hypothetical protein